MGFWDTFISVWQVRTSVRIQKNIESYLNQQNGVNELKTNVPKIMNELKKKNQAWEYQMKKLKKH